MIKLMWLGVRTFGVNAKTEDKAWYFFVIWGKIIYFCLH